MSDTIGAVQRGEPLDYREIRDENGRVYRVGESPKQLMGYGRWVMVLVPWIAMLSISTFEYGWGAAEKTLAGAYHWNLSQAFWNYTVYVIFEAGASFPTGWMREHHILKPRHAVLIGGVMVLGAYIALANSSHLWIAYVFYAAVGGWGSGMVYSSAINMTSKWYPERKGLRTGFVNGAYAYGSVPFIFLFSYDFTKSNYGSILVMVGIILGGILIASSFFFKDPPKNWWPAEVDPIAWRQNARSRALRKNPPAPYQWSPRETIRTWQVYALWITFVLIAGVSLFGTGFNTPFAKHDHFGAFVAAASLGLLAVVNGAGRAFVGWVSDQIGRRNTMTLFFAMEGVVQFGVLLAGEIHSAPLFIFFAFFAGLGGGCLFPLFATITPDYYGENNNSSNYGIVYSAKIVGGVYGGITSAVVVTHFGYIGAYVLAGCLGLLAAALTRSFRRPVAPAEAMERQRAAGQAGAVLPGAEPLGGMAGA